MSYTKRIFLKYILGACISCFMALQGHATVRNGADQLEKLLPLLEGKRVSLVVNHTSLCGKTHLLDTLVSLVKSYGYLLLNMDFEGMQMPENTFKTEKIPARGCPSFHFMEKTRNHYLHS